MANPSIRLLPVDLQLFRSLADHQPIDFRVVVLYFYLEEGMDDVAAGQAIQRSFLDLALVLGNKGLLLQLQCPFLEFIHVQPELLLLLFQDQDLLLQLLTLALSFP